MELKRASLVIGTPPATPRNSLLLPSNSGQMFDLQEFLSNIDTSNDSRSQRDTIHEVEEIESFDHLDGLPGTKDVVDFKASQHSMSQHSKSSGSLHSSPSITSVTRSNNQDKVIVNPAALAGNFNNSNNNSNVSCVSPNVILVEVTSPDRGRESVCSTQSSKAESVDSLDPLGGNTSSCSIQHYSETTNILDRDSQMSAEASNRLAVIPRGYSMSSMTKKQGGGGKSLFRKTFHQSSSDMLSGDSDLRAEKPPLVKKKVHKSATDLTKGTNGKGEGKKLKQHQKGSNKQLNLAELTDLKQSREVSSVSSYISTAIKITPQENARQEQPLATPLSSMTEIRKETQIPAEVPSSSEPHGAGSQESDELMSLEDFLSSAADGGPSSQQLGNGGRGEILVSTQGGGSGRGGALLPMSPHSGGNDSIWLDYGRF